MTEPKRFPAQTGIVSTLKRRSGPFLAAVALLLVVALSVSNLSDAESALVFGQPTARQPSTVSLVSQVAAQEAASDTALSVADVAETANAAVVTVYTFEDSAFPPLGPGQETLPNVGSSVEPTPLGAGSGWILNEEGYVVINVHVVEGADSFVVQYHDGSQVGATLVGTDAFQDVAVLELALEEGETVPGVSAIGDSAAMRPGDEVVAIGSPLGEFTNSVSDGTIGGVDRSLDVGNGMTLDNLIQHDAAIFPGNSGGPLLNMRCEVIGMNVAKVETAKNMSEARASGLNFAIDGNTMVGIAEAIIVSDGSIAFPDLGVQTQWTQQGAVVAAVESDTPAAQAGIEEGDIFTIIDGVAIDGDNALLRALLRRQPGNTVSIAVR